MNTVRERVLQIMKIVSFKSLFYQIFANILRKVWHKIFIIKMYAHNPKIKMQTLEKIPAIKVQ